MNMIRRLLEKWFNLEPVRCNTCEVLRESLEIERQFNRVLFGKLMGNPPAAELREVEEVKPLRMTPNKFIPSAVRQQMMEQEDLKTLELMRKFNKDITKDMIQKDELNRMNTEKLEKEVLGGENAS